MDTWFSALDGLFGGIQKTEDPFITALKKDVITINYPYIN